MEIEKAVHRSFIILSFTSMLVLLLPHAMQEGMFMDGTIYAAIARNLSIGQGSFWFPKFSNTEYLIFHDHPPLAFALEGFLFKMFGNAFFVEKLYSLLMAGFTALLIALIWRRILHAEKIKALFWLPVFLWIIIPKVFWSYNNNMLENTMGYFSMAAIYFLLLSIDQNFLKKIMLFGLAGLMVLFAFLSKGLPGLFPLAFFVVLFLSRKQSYPFKQMLKDSSGLLGLFVLLSVLFFYFNPSGFTSIQNYLQVQVVNSVSGHDRVGSRTTWFIEFFLELLPIILLTGICIWPKRYAWSQLLKSHPPYLQAAYLFLFIGFSASVPMSVSPKLSVYYLVPAFPYFALFLSAIAAPIIYEYLNHIQIKSWGFKLFNGSLILVLFATLVYSVSVFGTKVRDEDLLNDIEKIGLAMGPEKTLSVSESMYQDWRLIAYFQRKSGISIQRTSLKASFMLIEKKETFINQAYKIYPLALNKYYLFKKVN